jgi:photosystem I reaction center subunit XII
LYTYRFYRIHFLKLSVLYFLELKYFKFKIQELNMVLDSQVYIALSIALLAAVLAIQLGTTLYE